MLDCCTIDWVEADRNYVVVHAAGNEHVVRGTLAAFARALDPRVFVRVSRSASAAPQPAGRGVRLGPV